MEDTENLYIRLSDFDQSVKKYWQGVQLKTDFCDATLACDDKQIKVHKIIISSCSSILENILQQNVIPHPFIFLRNVRFKDLQCLLTFMYQGEIDIAKEDLQTFLTLAYDLKVRGLSKENQETSTSKNGNPTFKSSGITFPSQVNEELMQTENYSDNFTREKETQIKQVNAEKLNESSCESTIRKEEFDIHNQSIDKTKVSLEKNENNFLLNAFSFCNENNDGYNLKKENSQQPPGELKPKVAKNNKDDGDISTKNTLEVTENIPSNEFSKKDFLNFNQPYEKCVKMENRESVIQINNCLQISEDVSDTNIISSDDDKNGLLGLISNQIIINEDELEENVRVTIASTQEKGNICDTCGKQYSRSRHLRRHIESVHKGIHYACEQCNYKNKKRYELNKHLKEEHNTGPLTLLQEPISEKNTSDKRQIYKECDKSFSLKSTLRIHNASVHEGIFHHCKQCNHKARTNFLLKRHIEIVHKGTKIVCEKCNKQFRGKYGLAVHKASIHEGLRYPCNRCDQIFSHKANVKAHIASIHEGVCHPCELCTYNAASKSGLKVHIKTMHEGLKYPCNSCEYKATNSSSLAQHNRSIHQNIHYSCTECNFSTKRKSLLSKHMMGKHKGNNI